jgi:hypothetical protein
MTTQPWRKALFMALVGSVACGGTGDPERSYCEAVCDLAVTCHEGERTIDAAASTSACLDATNGVEDSCATAEAGEMNAAAASLLTPCVTDLDDATSAGECAAFTGSIDEIKQGITPTSCASQGTDAQATYNGARDATAEAGTDLCARMSTTFCGRVDECVVQDFGTIPDEAITLMGGTPFDLCVAKMDPVFTSGCATTDLYALETGGIDDVNIPRQGARECLRDFSSTDCVALMAGQLEETCALAFQDEAQLAAVATALFEVTAEVAAAVGGVGTGTSTGSTGPTTGATSGTTTGSPTGN